MNIGAKIRNLNRDLKSCEDMVTDIPKKKESCRAVHSLGNCGEERRTAFKVTVAGGARGKDYHRQCVPKHQKPATKKSPPRKQAHFQKREHFETESARVDIEIQSEKPLSKADIKCFTAGDEKSTTKPKVKSSWANILKEQNQSEPQCRASSREHCSRERSSSHEENCSRRVKDSAVQCNSPPSREKPAWPSKSFFSSYDPIRTLQFLMDEFKAKAKMKCEPGMGGIISDMDFAIQRLRQDGGSEVPLGRPISSTRDIGLNCNRLFSVAAPSTQLLSDKSPSDEISPRTKTQSASSSSSNIRRLEESYQALVKTCQAAEVRCTRLVEEREKQLRELGEKNLLLEQFARKECEYERKLSEAMNNIKMMETRSAQYTKSFTDLTEMLTKLQEENKVVGSLRENQGKLKVKVHELTQENHKLHTENQLMILEREKNKVLLQIKDQEINKLKNDIQKISSMVNEELKSRVKSLRLSSSSSIDLSGSDIDSSIAPSTSCKLDKQSRGHSDNLITSSPNSSSASSSPLPYMSWQKVSKIPSEPAISRQAERQERNGHETEAKCGKGRRKLPLDHEQKDVKTTGGGGGMECIEVLKAQLQGFVDNMKEQLQLGNQCLTVENRDTQEQSSGHDSSQSLCSLAMSEFSDTVRAPQPECNPGKNNSSYIDLSPYKNTGW